MLVHGKHRSAYKGRNQRNITKTRKRGWGERVREREEERERGREKEKEKERERGREKRERERGWRGGSRGKSTFCNHSRQAKRQLCLLR